MESKNEGLEDDFPLQTGSMLIFQVAFAALLGFTSRFPRKVSVSTWGFFYGSPCKVFNVGEYLLRSRWSDETVVMC